MAQSSTVPYSSLFSGLPPPEQLQQPATATVATMTPPTPPQQQPAAAAEALTTRGGTVLMARTAAGPQPLTIDLLRHYFHLPIQIVAGELGVCATQLKQLCRRHGVTRWPHRKIQSINNAMLQLETLLAKPDVAPEARAARMSELAALRARKRALVADPTTDVDLAAHHRASSAAAAAAAASASVVVPVTPLADEGTDEDVSCSDEETAADVLASVAAMPTTPEKKRSRTNKQQQQQQQQQQQHCSQPKRARLTEVTVEDCERCELFRRSFDALQAEHIKLLEERDALRRTIFELQQQQQQQQQQQVKQEPATLPPPAPPTTPTSEAIALATLHGWMSHRDPFIFAV